MAEGAYHAATCGAGIGLLLLARMSYILLYVFIPFFSSAVSYFLNFRLRETRVSQWMPLYLDEWGEEDINLKRGKPLYLNHEVSFLF